MLMAASSYGLSFLAGLLSILSPCVLPLVPIVVAVATASHRPGAVALAIGLAVSFVAVGIFVATVGFAIGLDAKLFRIISAVMLAGIGIVLVSGRFQAAFAGASSALGQAAHSASARLPSHGLFGQLVVGALLGAVWTPCVGPTLGAASLLAARHENLVQVALVMSAFGIGAALPLLVLGTLSREILVRWRTTVLGAATASKRVLGAAMIILSVVVVGGWDRQIEAALVNASPDWLTDLTTRY